MSRESKSHDFKDPGNVLVVPFHDTTRRRYLNYAMSVITSRALPDVRDGLKPVQRRILYAMYHDLHLTPDSKPMKCAKVVGECMGNYHPHGDTAIYDALVRMVQSWTLRYPLVFGQGNFGSMDGDSPAAYRYTEAKLLPLAMEFLEEMKQETVSLQKSYDGRLNEPVVLPAKVPQLLINGITGIAVGMATNIPPHNLKEVCEACIALIESRKLEVGDLVKIIRGPDFPTGGEILEDRATLRKIYEEGQGTIRVRGEYRVEEGNRGGQRIVITSIPYMINKANLVQSIGEIIASRKLPQLVDVRDESTDEVRIVIELKRESDAEMIMSFLYKHTQLQDNFSVNLTCLVPSEEGGSNPAGRDAAGRTVSGKEGGEDGRGQEVEEKENGKGRAGGGRIAALPARVNLRTLLVHFIDFRFEVVTRRLRHELRLLRERCHILEGFRKVFDALDEAIRIIRKSDGKQDAADKLMKRFDLDDLQAEAILELKLYKLARLEMEAILKELREKKAMIKELEALLDSPKRIWTIVKKELQEIGEKFGDERRTKVAARGQEEISYDAEAFIVDEDATILLTRDGWVRRVQKIGDLSKVRLRQDDELIAALGGNTKSSVIFFSNFGTAYTIRINDIPPSPRGFGDPIQRLFRFKDGERVLTAISLDERCVTDIGSAADPEGKVPKVHALAISSSGNGLRFALHPFAEPSTRAGRRFARVKEGEEIIDVVQVTGSEVIITASREGRALLCNASEINFLAGAGRGVRVLKLDAGDKVIGFSVSRQPREGLTVLREGGKEIPISPRSYKVTSRAGKGFELIKRGRLEKILRPPPTLPEFLLGEDGDAAGDGGGPSDKDSRDKPNDRKEG